MQSRLSSRAWAHRALVSLALLVATAVPSHAIDLPLTLVGGIHKSQQGAIDIRFTPAELTAMSDGSSLTGQVHTSTRGEVLDDQLVGVACRYDFDLPQLSRIDSVVVSWRGRFEWPAGLANLSSYVRIGPAEFQPRKEIWFPNTSSSVVESGSLTLTGETLAIAREGGGLSFWAETGFGNTTMPEWEWLRLETTDVTARVYGDLAPGPSTDAVTPALLFTKEIQGGRQVVSGYLDGGEDLDADGIPDILLGTPETSIGKLSIFSGGDASLIDELDGATGSDDFASGVAFVGDVDADGVSDFVVAISGTQSAALYSGATRTRLLPRARLLWGGAIVPLGDTNADSVPDFLVGVLAAGPDHLLATAYSGATGEPLYTIVDSSHVRGQVWLGDAIGDLDGDGVTEVILADKTTGPARSNAWIVSGRLGGILRRHEGPLSNRLGGWVHGLGDLDGDDRPDYTFEGTLFSGASGLPLYDTGGKAVGLGQLDGAGGNDVAVLVDGELWLFDFAANTRLGSIARPPITTAKMHGTTLSTAGDLDGDGTTDLLIAGPSADRMSIELEAFRILRGAPHPVAVDFLPRECPNDLGNRGGGPVDFAILAGAGGDLATIDPATIRLSGIAPSSVSPRGGDVGGASDPADCGCPDGALDGRDDLVLRFDSRDLRAALEPVVEGFTPRLRFSAQSTDGKAWFGEDCIVLGTNGRPRLAAGTLEGVRAVRSNIVAPGGRVELVYAAPLDDGPCRLSVYDVAGRRVATLVDGGSVESMRFTSWDGRDGSGAAVGRGIYFVQARPSGGTASSAMVIVR